MRCREVRCWLYSFRPTTSWPVDVVTHLQDCKSCLQLRTRLARIDDGMSKLTGGPSDGVAKNRLLERIAHTPQTVTMPKPMAPTQGWPWLRWGMYLTSAAALLAVGFWLGREPTPEAPPPVEIVKTVEVIREKPVPVEVIREKVVPVASNVDRSLFAALLKRNAQLVQATQPADRVDTLLDMADDCRKHALTLIGHGPRDSLPLTIDLYVQLLRDGVAAQLAQAPAPTRAALQQTARARLDKMALPTAPLTLPKVVEDQRNALQMATRQVREWIDQPESMPVNKVARSDASAAPTKALVQFAVAYCAEADPLAKADVCSDCVQRLMPSVMLALAEDAAPERIEMGQQFGEIIQHGIYAPLAVATAKEPAPPVKEQVDRLFQNAADTVAGMEEHLKKADDKTRPGLQRAIEATRKDTDRSKGKGKGKAKGHTSIPAFPGNVQVQIGAGFQWNTGYAANNDGKKNHKDR